jgi:hypothetical protein
VVGKASKQLMGGGGGNGPHRIRRSPHTPARASRKLAPPRQPPSHKPKTTKRQKKYKEYSDLSRRQKKTHTFFDQPLTSLPSLARANGAIDGPYCSPTWPSVFGRRCEPMAGGGAAPAPTCGAWGASSIRVPKKNARCRPGPPALCRKARPGCLSELRPLFPGGPGGGKPLLCHYPQAVSNVQEENLSCARGQVVITRPPVLTPPWRYRRFLVSKGRFTTSINVICVGVRSGRPKR